MSETINIGDVVRHFKRGLVELDNLATNRYLYTVKGFASHTETGEVLVIYQAMYAPFQTYARPIEDFCSLVDKEKYPKIKQKYRFEKYEYQPDYSI